ncbi:hypothetical protein [Leptospira noguchii]|uniref:hypothetical protein n=1 Tax=Leptospira noguchii TaxID=28182 RepID=UPI001FB68C49|nr:hypothetical protein [Leptospira noguchii]UOG36312.1 hypothetical protein MAL02_19390 [Leptospira noguchii]
MSWKAKRIRERNNETGEVNFEENTNLELKEEISVTDSGQINRITWNNVFW